MKKWNYIIAIIAAAIGIIFIALSMDFAHSVANAPGPGLWPRILGIGLIILSIFLILETLFGWNKNNDKDIDLTSPSIRKVYIMMGIIIGFGLLMYLLGFIIALMLFIPAVMYLLGERNPKSMLITSISITLSIFIVFVLVLHTPLPKPIFMR